MRIVSGTASGALRLGRYQRELSREARRRLKWMDYYEANGRNCYRPHQALGYKTPKAFYQEFIGAAA